MKRVQFGNTRAYPAQTDASLVITGGMQWVLDDFLGVARGIGVDPIIAVDAARFYYVPPTVAPGGNHSDPLSQAPETRGVQVLEHVLGWKLELFLPDGAYPEEVDDYVITEGSAPRVAL